MDILKRLFGETKELDLDVPDYPPYEPGKKLPEQGFNFSEAVIGMYQHHPHAWNEKRITAIEATCTECGAKEMHPNHRGRLKGQKYK